MSHVNIRGSWGKVYQDSVLFVQLKLFPNKQTRRPESNTSQPLVVIFPISQTSASPFFLCPKAECRYFYHPGHALLNALQLAKIFPQGSVDTVGMKPGGGELTGPSLHLSAIPSPVDPMSSLPSFSSQPQPFSSLGPFERSTCGEQNNDPQRHPCLNPGPCGYVRYMAKGLCRCGQAKLER